MTDANNLNFDSVISDELGGGQEGDPIINKYNTDINTKTLEVLNEKNPIKKYELQTQLNSINRQKTFYIIKQYFKKFIFYIFLLGLFSLNLIAVAVSLSMNRNKSILFKIFSSIYAFFFSILYILINYRHYRLDIKKEINTICPNKPFKFF